MMDEMQDRADAGSPTNGVAATDLLSIDCKTVWASESAP